MAEDSERIGGGALSKVEKLKLDPYSYILWKRAVTEAMTTMSDMYRIVLFSQEGEDDFVQEMEDQPGDSDRVLDRKEKERRQFDKDCGLFIMRLMSTMSQVFREYLEVQDGFAEAVANREPTHFWDVVENTVRSLDVGGQMRMKAERYLMELKQNSTESFEQYTRRFNHAVEHVHLLSGEQRYHNPNLVTMYLHGISLDHIDVKKALMQHNNNLMDLTPTAICVLAKAEQVRNQNVHAGHRSGRAKPGPGDVIVAGLDEEHKNAAGTKRVANVPSGGNKRANVVCYGCKEKGHIRRDCPKLAASAGKNGSDVATSTNGNRAESA